MTRTEVVTGLSNDEEVEIISGISEGDSVATANLSRLNSGTKVVRDTGETK